MYRSEQEMLAIVRGRGTEINQRRWRRFAAAIGITICLVALPIARAIALGHDDHGSTIAVLAGPDTTPVTTSIVGVTSTATTDTPGTSQELAPGTDVTTTEPDVSTTTGSSSTIAPKPPTTTSPVQTELPTTVVTSSEPPITAVTTTAAPLDRCAEQDILKSDALDTPTVKVGDKVRVTSTSTNVSGRPCLFSFEGIFGYTITDTSNKPLFREFIGISAAAPSPLLPGDKRTFANEWDQRCFPATGPKPPDGTEWSPNCPQSGRAPVGTYIFSVRSGSSAFTFKIT